ncbi:AGC/PKG protein kinase [Salpingoeca rosetta]|uniref:cGMP-dependent protein kinase n=1 Tax=Salpingoeca rosetta (strain ATCC 50818 / BSB-021) TaxID=946362 RepID=F2UPI0_SALR5|nr:AGC/PKG protein kinase [Salpingoeca rosetta]EGD79535.1 AGC/PKG protein kinase [Salpingoeca rosetta]|eukprot:XP_004989016.1 AGC/PKG protein kinase [Salpingoeca rosetta]
MGAAASQANGAVVNGATGTVSQPANYGLVAESRLLRLQKDLDAANHTIQSLRNKLAKAQTDVGKFEKKQADLQLTNQLLLKEVDKLRCIADQHRRRDVSITAGAKAKEAGLDDDIVGHTPPALGTDHMRPGAKDLPGGGGDDDMTAAASTEPAHHRRGVVALAPKKAEATSIPKTRVLDDTTRALIMRALQANPYTSKLTLAQQREVAVHMSVQDIAPGEVVIQQGDVGECLYVIAAGIVTVSTATSDVQNDIMAGTVIGELALLYDCTRTATITAKTKVKVFAIDRHTFKIVAREAKLKERERLLSLFQQMPLLRGLNDDYVLTIVDLAKEVAFDQGEAIVEEGQHGDVFYLITEGQVLVTQDNIKLRTLRKGDHFGEGALLEAYNIRTATCKALTEVTCASLSREAFLKHIVPLEALGRLSYLDVRQEEEESVKNECKEEFKHITLESLEQRRILGVGAFGRVTLVREAESDRMFALKAIAKAHIIENGQEDYVVCEKRVMESLNTLFCAPLYRTFKDERYIFMLTEALLGGELWKHLRAAGRFSDDAAKFYVACVVEAFSFLHNRSIVYRDLKPENIMMTSTGYVKLVDFGFARKLSRGTKTWTFCGTPEYMAPEIVMNQGHDGGVDYWALGVLTYELLSGRTPFACNDDMDTYNLIILGIDHVRFDAAVSGDARDLILGFCRETASERTGCDKDGIKTIQRHRWFKDFNWPALETQTMPAPTVPTLDGPEDCRYFDEYTPREEPPVIGSCPWDADF